MSEAFRMHSDWYRVGLGYRVQFDLKMHAGEPPRFDCSWEPHLPTPRDVRRILAGGKYHRSRDEFMRAVATKVGGLVIVLDEQPEAKP